MRILRGLPPLLAIGGCLLGAIPAAAADSPVSLSLAQRWNDGQPGAWTPYVATVRNDGATDFTGDVTLHPVPNLRLGAGQAWPDYHARITVPHGSQRSATFYVVEPQAGYEASLADSGGHTLATGVTVGGLAEAGFAVAVLSDQTQAASRIDALKPLASSGFSGGSGLRVSRFESAQDFPANAVFLSGLNAVVVDDFDVSTLSDAQIRALKDFVGLGGSLVVAGGASWRRTLLPLAQKGFAGLNPSRSGEAPLQPLADLAARTTALVVPIAEGDASGARTLLGAPGGVPLALQADYGAGRILDLAYDPLAAPISTDPGGMDALAWTMALDRAVLDSFPAGGRATQPPTTFAGGPGTPVVAPGISVAADQIVGILQSTPAAAVPPVGLLGTLLVIYVLLAGPLNYAAVKAFGRRELMWVSVPLVAVLFTSAAYVAGAGVHGSAYFDNEVQMLRLGPDGVAEVHAYHGLYPPRRGDFTVDVAANTLASTALGSMVGAGTPEAAVVNTGSRTQVVLKDSSYGGYRGLQTLAIARAPLQPAVALEAHLRITQNRVTGTVRNSGDRPVEELSLVGGSGQLATIASDLPPRATVDVDAPLSAAGQATPFPTQRTVYGSGGTDYKRQSLLRIAQGTAVTGHPGDWALTGLTDPSGGLVVDGGRPSHSGLAALVAPVALESVDSLSFAPPPLALLSDSAVPYHYDVFDLEVPPGYSGPLKLTYDATSGAGVNSPAAQAPVRSIEVYDWTSGTWRPLPATASGASARSVTAALAAGEAPGMVRVRVNEQTDYPAANMRLVAG